MNLSDCFFILYYCLPFRLTHHIYANEMICGGFCFQELLSSDLLFVFQFKIRLSESILREICYAVRLKNELFIAYGGVKYFTLKW
jgi:hypothetical protein